jgi:hypothetical protein
MVYLAYDLLNTLSMSLMLEKLICVLHRLKLLINSQGVNIYKAYKG